MSAPKHLKLWYRESLGQGAKGSRPWLIAPGKQLCLRFSRKWHQQDLKWNPQTCLFTFDNIGSISSTLLLFLFPGTGDPRVKATPCSFRELPHKLILKLEVPVSWQKEFFSGGLGDLKSLLLGPSSALGREPKKMDLGLFALFLVQCSFSFQMHRNWSSSFFYLSASYPYRVPTVSGLLK